jgi:hypothetical protein
MAGECRRAPFPDFRWSNFRETGVPQDLPDGDEQTATWCQFMRVSWRASASVECDGSLPTQSRHPHVAHATVHRVADRDYRPSTKRANSADRNRSNKKSTNALVFEGSILLLE